MNVAKICIKQDSLAFLEGLEAWSLHKTRQMILQIAFTHRILQTLVFFCPAPLSACHLRLPLGV